MSRVRSVFIKTKHITGKQIKVLTAPLNKQRSTPGENQRLYSSKPSGYWDYTKKHGPANWGKTWDFNERQSPIDILTKLAKYNPKLGEYNVDHTPIQYKTQNVGMNVSTVPDADQTGILLTGGALPNEYRLREFHFHWAKNNSCGCEHTLNGHRFAAELHLVHWNTDLYQKESDALSNKDGLAVLGVFLDACSTHAPNPALNVVLDLFQQVRYKNQTFVSQPFSPYSLLPSNTNEYFTYPGSLTTPPLTENVTWTVFRHPLKVSVCQIEKFNQLFAVDKNDKDKKYTEDLFARSSNTVPQPPTISNNYRPVQPLNGRVVHSSFKL